MTLTSEVYEVYIGDRLSINQQINQRATNE